MLIPSMPVVIAAVAALAILLGLTWLIGGIAYSRKPAHLSAANSPHERQALPGQRSRLMARHGAIA